MSGNAMKLCNFAFAILALLLVSSTGDAFHMISPEKAAETITTTTTLVTSSTTGTTKITAAVNPTSVDVAAAPPAATPSPTAALTTIVSSAAAGEAVATTTIATATSTKQQKADEMATTASTNDDEAATVEEKSATPLPMMSSTITATATSPVPVQATTSKSIIIAAPNEKAGQKFKDANEHDDLDYMKDSPSEAAADMELEIQPKQQANLNLTKGYEKPSTTTTKTSIEVTREIAYTTTMPKTMTTTTSEQLLVDSTGTSSSATSDEPTTVVPNVGTAGKMNIADLYPVRMEDFNPIIRDSNAELLKERPIFTRTDNDEHRQNLMPNEVEDHHRGGPIKGTAPSLNRAAKLLERSSISDFTGKLLAEQDGVITEIEQKFRLHEERGDAATTTTTTTESSNNNAAATAAPTTASTKRDKLSFSINHQIPRAHGQQFIDRRVKKSFEFPMHRVVSDGVLLLQPHIDFANTKFNTDTSRHPPGLVAGGPVSPSTFAGGPPKASGLPLAVAMHPEFSTTKFYNSKELYNEMMMHNHNNNNNNNNNNNSGGKPKTMTIIMPQNAAASNGPANTTPTPAAAQPTVRTNEKQKFVTSLPVAKFRSFEHLKDFRPSNQKTQTTTTTTTTTVPPNQATTITAGVNLVPTAKPTNGEDVETPAEKLKKIQKELKRAKLLLQTAAAAASEPTTIKTITADDGTTTTTTAAATTTTQTTTSLMQSTTTTSSGQPLTMTAIAIDTEDASDAVNSVASYSSTSTGAVNVNSATTSTLRPIARPRILRRLQEKINSLECEIQNVPQESHLWRGNETHELLLPIVESPKKCAPVEGLEKCSPKAISWDGEAEIQSGDVLIVEINDAQLTEQENNTNPNSAHNTQVYQVTRSGHEHCDVTEGILLDITPLVVDGRKLVTLYDKDLTEGVNLLIVVSDLWGSQCVRLKVTTKTDNCGENADCSGKGVCYSNPAMEDYECQCCSGFAGPHCEEIDACTPSPCTNNGICVDLSQGHEGNSYQCLCPYGYSGKNCQYETDPCNPTECLNGGSCVGNSTHFRCDCTPGYTGPLCQHSLNECESSPCVHGICVDQEDGFRCFCQPGFAGELCNFEYNECESNPCQNSGECIDHIGSYECRCTKGYTGNRCQIKVDFCANKPCPDGHKCIDHGNEFSCQCPGGLNGLNCNQMPRTQCNVNPCTHGGTCWSSGDSFYCACRPGYTGTMCEDEFVVETVVSSSEFIVDDTSARNFNDKTFSSSVVLKSPIELHNAYFAAGVLAAAIFIVAIVVTICHCKVNQTYRKFSTRTTTFFPILGFGRRPKMQNKLNKHWLSGKSAANGTGGGGGGVGSNGGCANGSGNPLRSSSSSASLTRGHLAATNGNQYTTTGSTALHHNNNNNSQLHERPFQRHLAMNLENDMYYTVDFSENSQHSPLIQ